MRHERGASLLIPVILIVTAGAFAVVVAASHSGGDIAGSEAQADSMEALFLAETGVERATRRFLAGVACDALGELPITNLGEIGIASARSITISAGANSGTDFSGAALPATQCRIQATGTVSRNNVSRSVQAIIDRDDNLAGAAAVAGFDNPAGAANPAASWTGGAYDYTGGNAGGVNPPNCTRSAYIVKPRVGGAASAASSAGTAPMRFTVSLPATVLVRFDYRIVRIANSGSDACVSASGAGGCPGAADATSPSGAAGDGEICFTLRDTAGATYNSTKAAVDQSANIPLSVTGPACTPTTQQTPTNAGYTPCGLEYNSAAARFTIAGAGTLSFDRLGFQMFIPSGGQAYEMWIDNVSVTPNATIGGIAAWRDCTVSACPAV